MKRTPNEHCNSSASITRFYLNNIWLWAYWKQGNLKILALIRISTYFNLSKNWNSKCYFPRFNRHRKSVILFN